MIRDSSLSENEAPFLITTEKTLTPNLALDRSDGPSSILLRADSRPDRYRSRRWPFSYEAGTERTHFVVIADYRSEDDLLELDID